MTVFFSWLAQVLVHIFGKTFLRASFKISMFASFLTLFYAAIYAYIAAAKLMFNSLGQTIPYVVSGVWGWVMPTNINQCLLAIVSATLLRFFSNLYRTLFRDKLSLAKSI